MFYNGTERKFKNVTINNNGRISWVETTGIFRKVVNVVVSLHINEGGIASELTKGQATKKKK